MYCTYLPNVDNKITLCSGGLFVVSAAAISHVSNNTHNSTADNLYLPPPPKTLSLSPPKNTDSLHSSTPTNNDAT